MTTTLEQNWDTQEVSLHICNDEGDYMTARRTRSAEELARMFSGALNEVDYNEVNWDSIWEDVQS